MASKDRKERPLSPESSALVIVDMQKVFAMPGIGLHKDVDPDNIPAIHAQYFFSRMRQTAVPATRCLLEAFRKKKREVIFVAYECLTKDGRDQSNIYTRDGLLSPRGSVGAEMLDELTPGDDEIVIRKTSWGVFNSSNIEYVLRNLGVTELVFCGIMTNHCVETAIRDAADRSFHVTLVEDACATYDQQQHDAAVQNIGVFGRIAGHQEVVQEVENWEDKK